MDFKVNLQPPYHLLAQEDQKNKEREKQLQEQTSTYTLICHLRCTRVEV